MFRKGLPETARAPRLTRNFHFRILEPVMRLSPPRFLHACTLVFVGLMAPISAHAEGKSIIVLDASGSMWGQIDGRAKLEIAREALAGVLAGVPAETELG